jgi:hypothetical protein
MNEDRLLNLEQGVIECQGEYSIDMIAKTERMMLLLLDFMTNLPTPLDFIQYFLYLSHSTFDFSVFINECLSLVYFSLIGKKFKRYYL